MTDAAESLSDLEARTEDLRHQVLRESNLGNLKREISRLETAGQSAQVPRERVTKLNALHEQITQLELRRDELY